MKTFSTIPPKTEKSREIPCPLCQSIKYEKHWDLESFFYSQCPNCSLIYQNPQPISEDVEERYDESYFSYEIENEDSFLNLMLLGLKDMKFDVTSSITDNKKILDIGCATGLFLSHMKKLGWQTFGVEVCESAVDYGNSVRGLDIYKGILDNAPIPVGSLDVIHLSHVIEHINDPNTFVEHIFKLLKPGGVVYCTTPNVSGLQSKIFKNRWRSAIPDHMILFSVKTLKQIFVQNNFRIYGHKTWGGLCANSGYPKHIKILLDKLAKPLGFGDVVIIKAVKPL
ncbi:MAG: class I SAM-dependent methyltransferase [Spirochaetaceae bacterium]